MYTLDLESELPSGNLYYRWTSVDVHSCIWRNNHYLSEQERCRVISQGCCNDVSQPGWLKRTQYSLTVRVTRSPKSRCQQSCAPSTGSQRFIPWLFQLLGMLGIPWLVAASLPSLPPSSQGLFLLPVSSLHVVGTFVSGVRATKLGSHLQILKLMF